MLTDACKVDRRRRTRKCVPERSRVGGDADVGPADDIVVFARSLVSLCRTVAIAQNHSIVAVLLAHIVHVVEAEGIGRRRTRITEMGTLTGVLAQRPSRRQADGAGRREAVSEEMPHVFGRVVSGRPMRELAHCDINAAHVARDAVATHRHSVVLWTRACALRHPRGTRVGEKPKGPRGGCR